MLPFPMFKRKRFGKLHTKTSLGICNQLKFLHFLGKVHKINTVQSDLQGGEIDMYWIKKSKSMSTKLVPVIVTE